LEHRKITALGMVADGAGATTRTTAYLHLDLADLPELPDATSGSARSRSSAR
jgi:hypothetical protein